MADHEHLALEREVEVDLLGLFRAAGERKGAHGGERKQEGAAGGAKLRTRGKVHEQAGLLGL
jgi:hypothetical protein